MPTSHFQLSPLVRLLANDWTSSVAVVPVGILEIDSPASPGAVVCIVGGSSVTVDVDLRTNAAVKLCIEFVPLWVELSVRHCGQSVGQIGKGEEEGWSEDTDRKTGVSLCSRLFHEHPTTEAHASVQRPRIAVRHHAWAWQCGPSPRLVTLNPISRRPQLQRICSSK